MLRGFIWAHELRLRDRQLLEFQGFNGESKVRLLPTPWPLDALPPPTSSLLSVASNRSLIAAAGPDSVVIASTDAVRETFSAKSEEGNIKPFTPQLVLPIGTRVSQVAFSADESCLAICAEAGGGLAVYETGGLLQNKTHSAFEMATNGSSVRGLVPNPSPEKAELFAVITTNGDLLIADMKSRQYIQGSNGQVIADGVSCVSWSNKGTQLVAGMGNGSAVQMTPQGQIKAQIPRADVEGDQHGR